MPKSQKSCNRLQAQFLSLLLNNQKEIMKRGMTWAEQKPKGITFKVHSLAIENALYMDLIHQCICNGCHMRQCLNELQKEYCVKRKHIALDWQWVTLISWCQMNRLGHSSQVMHKVNIFKKLKITSPKSNLFGLFLRSIFLINFFLPLYFTHGWVHVYLIFGLLLAI